MDDSETALGITVYLGSHEGFSAVSKARYSDFVVHESTFLTPFTHSQHDDALLPSLLTNVMIHIIELVQSVSMGASPA
jgi:hypothetical protein